MSRHTVLQCITPSRVAGAERHLAWLAPRLRARGHAVSIACNESSRGLENFRALMQQSDFDVAALPIGGKANLRALAALLGETRRTRAKLTHSHLSSASWWCGWLQNLGGCPSLGHVHGFTSARWHSRQKQLIACSGAVKQHLVAQGLDAARIAVLHNPVDAADLKPARAASDVRAEIGADESTPVVGTFAHLSEKKGWREWLGAIPEVLRAQPKTQFWCVGDGPMRAELENAAQQNNFAPSVRFLGFRRDVADVMNAIDVMALPSHREPFGLVYVEAALLGKPSVACNAGGAPEVVVDGETGILVAPRDADSLARGIIEILDDRARAERMGNLARERALDLFGWSTFLPQLESLYDKVIA